jgi:hypothetical protein
MTPVEEIWSTALRQAPSLAVLAFVVVQFLKHMRARDAVLTEISDGCHEVQRDAIKCISDNTRVLGEHHHAMDEIAKEIRALRRARGSHERDA